MIAFFNGFLQFCVFLKQKAFLSHPVNDIGEARLQDRRGQNLLEKKKYLY